MKRYFCPKGMIVFVLTLFLGLLVFAGFTRLFKEPTSVRQPLRLDSVTKKALTKMAQGILAEQVVLTDDNWKMSVESLEILDAKGWKTGLRVCYRETERSEKFNALSINSTCSVENLPDGATVNDLFIYTERATSNVGHMLTEPSDNL